jgi:hypothetical protein
MDGRSWGIDGELVAARRAARFIHGLTIPLLHPTDSAQFRIGLDADAGVLPAQYAGDTTVTLPAAAPLKVLGRNPMKNKTLASAVVDLAARHVKMVNCISWSLPMTGVVRGDGRGVAVGSRSTRNSDGRY